MNALDITESKARYLINRMCRDFNVTPCKVFFVNINDPYTVGWYEPAHPNIPAYLMVEKKWSNRLILVLHEFTHHVQEELYDETGESIHGLSFQNAKSRVAIWASNNISKQYDWKSLIQRYTIGKRRR